MRVDILHYVKMLLILLLTGSLVGNAYGQNKSNDIYNKQTVQTVVLDKNTTLYQFALSHSMTVEALLKLNPSLNKTDTLVQGTEIKVFSAEAEGNTESTDSTLPALGNSSLTGNESSALNSTGEFLLSAVPGSKMLTGTAEENAANAAIFAGNQEWENLSGDKILENIENQAVNKVVGDVNQKINDTASNFLGRFGKAEVSIALDKEGQLSSYNLNLLSPIYDKDESLIFSQVGVHEQGSGDNSRLIGNFGLGYRYETNDWLAGANTFIDHDFTGNNTRLGFGGEYWRDNYKIATNAYMPLSNWKQSAVMKNYEQLIYDERPAKGFDIRAQAYLPSYPQLGGSVTFEQYFGEEVDLFGIENRQKDPYSLSVGINYMPVPLLKTEVSHKMGKDGVNDTKVDLSLNVQLGTPIEEQLNPDNVAIARSLKGSRYDMVDRNYDIVFEYQKEDFSIEISGTNRAGAGDMISIASSIRSKSPIVKYEWFVKDVTGQEHYYLANDTKNISFEMKETTPFDLYVTLRVTTERGFSAESKPHKIEYIMSKTQSVLTSGKAEVISFDDYPELGSVDYMTALERIPDSHKANLIFMARDEKGNPFDVNDLSSLELKWRVKGTVEFHSISPLDLAKFFILPGEDDSTLNIVVVADSHLIPTSGNKSVELVVISKNNPSVAAMAEIEFSKSNDIFTPLGIDLQNLKVQIWSVPQGDNVFTTYDDLVSESGIVGGVALKEHSGQIKPNTQYRAIIKTLKANDNGIKEWTDVTEYFLESMVWLYWDPVNEREVTAVNNPAEVDVNGKVRKYRALEECRGSPIFFTQTNNYLFNELGWGEILSIDNSQTRENRIVNEQGLRLAVQFDFTAINAKNPAIGECIPTQEYKSAPNYTGYFEGEKLKATSWSN